jgi:hypothetical protein
MVHLWHPLKDVSMPKQKKLFKMLVHRQLYIFSYKE